MVRVRVWEPHLPDQCFLVQLLHGISASRPSLYCKVYGETCEIFIRSVDLSVQCEYQNMHISPRELAIAQHSNAALMKCQTFTVPPRPQKGYRTGRIILRFAYRIVPSKVMRTRKKSFWLSESGLASFVSDGSCQAPCMPRQSIWRCAMRGSVGL